MLPRGLQKILKNDKHVMWIQRHWIQVTWRQLYQICFNCCWQNLGACCLWFKRQNYDILGYFVLDPLEAWLGWFRGHVRKFDSIYFVKSNGQILKFSEWTLQHQVLISIERQNCDVLGIFKTLGSNGVQRPRGEICLNCFGEMKWWNFEMQCLGSTTQISYFLENFLGLSKALLESFGAIWTKSDLVVFLRRNEKWIWDIQ